MTESNGGRPQRGYRNYSQISWSPSALGDDPLGTHRSTGPLRRPPCPPSHSVSVPPCSPSGISNASSGNSCPPMRSSSHHLYSNRRAARAAWSSIFEAQSLPVSMETVNIGILPPSSAEERRRNGRTRSSLSLSYDGGFFNLKRGPRRRDFIIDPEWMSETLPLPSTSGIVDNGNSHRSLLRGSGDLGNWPRRCHSVPPKTALNPITWQ